MATPGAKSRRIELRISEEERRMEEAAAAAVGESLSEFMRQAARARAEEILRERGRIVLTDRVGMQLLERLDEDAPPPPEMRELFERPSPWTA